MADAIVKGKVVQLKSGGPEMTVRWVEHDEGETRIGCEWFNDKDELKNSTFLVDSLDIIR
ncbi:DUF2158 domain-containing protein [Dongia sp.]|uniref:DUF2158 domain-containing protein n=1 Tax=Dongia sp. TaxID=1977262 RepID=UPI0035B101A1